MKISRYNDIDMILESELKVENPLMPQRKQKTTLVVNIGDKTFYNREAYKTFVEVVEEISTIMYRLIYIKNTYIYSKYKDMESIFQGENILEFIK